MSEMGSHQRSSQSLGRSLALTVYLFPETTSFYCCLGMLVLPSMKQHLVSHKSSAVHCSHSEICRALFVIYLTLLLQKHSADYVIIDMSPSLGPINQNLLMVSDHFIVPLHPDYFSSMALSSLAKIVPRWKAWGSNCVRGRCTSDCGLSVSRAACNVHRSRSSKIPSEIRTGKFRIPAVDRSSRIRSA